MPIRSFKTLAGLRKCHRRGQTAEEVLRENEKKGRQAYERHKNLFEVRLITYDEYLALCSCQREKDQALGVNSLSPVTDNSEGRARGEGADIWAAYRWLLDENLISPNEHVALCSFYVAETYGL